MPHHTQILSKLVQSSGAKGDQTSGEDSINLCPDVCLPNYKATVKGSSSTLVRVAERGGGCCMMKEFWAVGGVAIVGCGIVFAH